MHLSRMICPLRVAIGEFRPNAARICNGNHGGVHLLPNNSRRCRHLLRCAFMARFRAARERIWLTFPYFVPDSRSRSALCDAACRGIDVRVLVPAKRDADAAAWAAQAAYARMLTSGVRIWEYLPQMLHAKTVLVDQDWATVGTANFDYRSFFPERRAESCC